MKFLCNLIYCRFWHMTFYFQVLLLFTCGCLFMNAKHSPFTAVIVWLFRLLLHAQLPKLTSLSGAMFSKTLPAPGHPDGPDCQYPCRRTFAFSLQLSCQTAVLIVYRYLNKFRLLANTYCTHVILNVFFTR